MGNINLEIIFKNSKCFGKEGQIISEIYPINLIIGKNNSGKSAILDIVQYVTNAGSVNLVGHQNGRPEVLLKRGLSEFDIKKTFPEDKYGGGISERNFFEFGKNMIGRPLTIKLENSGEKKFIDLSPVINLPERVVSQHQFYESLTKNFYNPLQGKLFKKISAERDITPEPHEDITLLPDGKGATNTIQKFINLASLNKRSIVEEDLLNALNEIFYPEAKFDRILAQQLDDERWEIYLEEKAKGNISLTNSGSGLKTVILVLVNILLLPRKEQQDLSKYIFAFEELENNLHPSLQRKLLLYIKNIAEKKNCNFFLTTHSNVIIDLFSNDESAQIIHVVNNGVTASAKRIKSYKDNCEVLNDLDFRASDLLQSNGVIWVEGPSDRTYINHWIKLWTGGELKEGVHYQCLSYGGRLLYHFTASEESLEEAISILRINRNCILLMDSDKKKSKSKINEAKKRIKQEIEKINGMAWVTKGKEVENYIPTACLKNFFSAQKQKELGQFEDFTAYLNRVRAGEGKKFERSKSLFAKNILPFINKVELKEKLDLDKRMKEVVSRIKAWNRLN